MQAKKPQKAVPKAETSKPSKPKPEWNSQLSENPHKLSHAELLQRKLNARSKNETIAREEYRSKLEALQRGELPTPEYKEIVNGAGKQFTSKQAFITNKKLEREYQNRSHASIRPASARPCFEQPPKMARPAHVSSISTYLTFKRLVCKLRRFRYVTNKQNRLRLLRRPEISLKRVWNLVRSIRRQPLKCTPRTTSLSF